MPGRWCSMVGFEMCKKAAIPYASKHESAILLNLIIIYFQILFDYFLGNLVALLQDI